ncbi:hypothetical protein CLIM01_12670, partial [Colletotrichum limetticola]
MMEPMMLVGDIVEKETAPAKPVVFDDIDAAPTGFPAHKKRAARVSAFKQQRQGKPTTGAQAAAATSSIQPKSSEDVAVDSQKSFEAAERRRIDRENRQKLEDMSPEDIAQERQELLNSLDPSLIQRLLGRANIDEQHGPNPFDPPADETKREPPAPTPEIKIEDTSAPPKPKPAPKPATAPKSVSFADEEDEPTSKAPPKPPHTHED